MTMTFLIQWVRQHTSRKIIKTLLVCSVTFFVFQASLANSISVTKQRGVAATAQNRVIRSQQSDYLPQLDLQKTFKGHDVSLLGFTNQGTALLVAEKSNSDNVGNIVQWDVGKNRMADKLALSKRLSSYFLTLSADGRFLATSKHVTDAHNAVVLSSTRFRTSLVSDLGPKNGVTGFLFSPNGREHVVVKMNSLIPYENTFTYGKNRFEWLNLRTGKIDKVLPYSPANECDKILLSPDKSYLACLFYSGRFNPRGDDSYGNELERKGFVDILDPKTGKILWHIAATEKQPVGDPLFFISPTQFISSDTLFDIKTKTAKPWRAVNASRRCLADVPGHSAYALFWTKAGVELRNWKANRVMRRWPTLKKQGRILFSPDLKMFSFKRDQVIQFWKFDPKWLK